MRNTGKELLADADRMRHNKFTQPNYRIGKKSAYSKLVKYADSLTKLSTFHDDDLDGSTKGFVAFAGTLYETTDQAHVGTPRAYFFMARSITSKSASLGK